MDKINYSKCPLKKRPIYFIKEESEENLEDGPMDLTVPKKWHNNFKITPKFLLESTQIPINYSRKLHTIEEENIDYENLQNNSTLYDLHEQQHHHQHHHHHHQDHQEQQYHYRQQETSININDNENEQKFINISSNYVDRNVDKNFYGNNVDRNFNNNLIKSYPEYTTNSNNSSNNNSNNSNINKTYYNNRTRNISSRTINSTNNNNNNNNNNLCEINEMKFINNSEPRDLTIQNEFISSDDLVYIKNDSLKYQQKDHAQQHHDKTNNDLYYQCSTCKKCYSTHGGLLKHQLCHTLGGNVNNNAGREQNLIKIETNNERLPLIDTNQENLLNNRSQKLINVQRYQCNDCGKSYSTISGLTKHQQFHCPNSKQNQIKKTFSCKNCDKVYVSLGALKMHIRTHTLPCKCPLCGKAFSRPWLLQGHIRTHTGEKPFTCQHCSRAFADRSNLRAHLQTHSEVKKYSCTSCTKTFSRMSLLGKHLQSGCSGNVTTNDDQYNNEYDENNDDLNLYSAKRTPVIVENNYYDNNQHHGEYSNENSMYDGEMESY